MQEFYIEKIDGGIYNFKLWEKDRETYFNIATLFYQDDICGTQWIIDDKAIALHYNADEIQDELENPLKQISAEKTQQLLKLTSAEEVVNSLEGLLE